MAITQQIIVNRFSYMVKFTSAIKILQKKLFIECSEMFTKKQQRCVLQNLHGDKKGRSFWAGKHRNSVAEEMVMMYLNDNTRKIV